MIATLVWLALQAAPAITERPDGAGGWTVAAAPFDATGDVAAALERRVVELARSRCGERTVVWGAFASTQRLPAPGDARSVVRDFSRSYRCAEAPVAVVAATVPAGWQPDAQDEAQVRAFATRFFAARDAGDPARAWAMTDEGAGVDRADYFRDLAAERRSAGHGERRIVRVTWYVDPPGAPRLGAYAAVDFTGRYAGLAQQCGYVVLYRRGAGDYRVVREDTSNVPRSTRDDAQARAIAAATCPGGA